MAATDATHPQKRSFSSGGVDSEAYFAGDEMSGSVRSLYIGHRTVKRH